MLVTRFGYYGYSNGIIQVNTKNHKHQIIMLECHTVAQAVMELKHSWLSISLSLGTLIKGYLLELKTLTEQTQVRVFDRNDKKSSATSNFVLLHRIDKNARLGLSQHRVTF